MPPPEHAAVEPQIRPLLISWLLLLLLGGMELVASYLPLPRAWRPVIMIPGVLMVIVVALSFMEVRRGPVIVRAFAVAGLFWLFILLALGSTDPLTRVNYYVAPVAGQSDTD
jgi:cytochrome c oxidase subunit 4